MALLLVLGLHQAGCVNPPRQRTTPELPTSVNWSVPLTGATESDGRAWWERFENPVLNRLVASAIASNANLATLARRVDLARARGNADTAGALPSVSASTSLRAGKEHSRETFFQTRSVMPWVSAGAASWEIDWLGKWRARKNAAREFVSATEADLNAGRLLIAGDVMVSWFNLQRRHDEIAIIEASLRHQDEILRIYRDRLRAGLVEAAVIDRQESEAASLKRQLVKTRMLTEVVTRKLDQLLGKIAGEGSYELSPRLSESVIPKLPDALPSDVLRRRPDMAAAEARLRAAYSLERAAKLDLYPSLNLRLGGVTMTGSLADPFRSWITEIGPRLEIPIWDATRRAESSVSSARAKLAAAEYRATALRAIEDVEIALITFHRAREQLSLANEIVQRTVAVRDRTADRFRAGLVSQLEQLEDERRTLAARLLATELQAELLASAVAVFRAMGG